jgi:hypothetical protein
MTDMALYQRQGLGARLGAQGQIGLLIVDFLAGFADPAVFGGGTILAAMVLPYPCCTKHGREGGLLLTAASSSPTNLEPRRIACFYTRKNTKDP